jgi:hypothetical protein
MLESILGGVVECPRSPFHFANARTSESVWQYAPHYLPYITPLHLAYHTQCLPGNDSHTV